MMEKSHSPYMIKVYVAAIAALHALIANQSVGRNNMVVCFLLGSRSLFSPHPLTVPTWVLPMVLRFLRISHFEPLQFTNLWPLGVRALRIYIERSAPFKQSEQHFVCFSGQAKGLPVTKQRLSRLIVDAISVAYSYLGLQCPIGVRAHSSRGVASSWAWPSRCVHCRALKSGWLGLVIHLFMFYNLEVPALRAQVLAL